MAVKLTTYYSSKDIPILPGNNTFHSKELFEVYEKTKGYIPILIVATDKEIVLGKLLATIRKKATYAIIPARIKKCEIYDMGEYFCDEKQTGELFKIMLQHLTKEAFRHAFLIEFRNLNNSLENYKHFRDNRYFPINWLRVRNRLDGQQPIEEHFSESRLRQIKKGLKTGVILTTAKSEEEVNQFSKLLRKIYSTRIRRHFPNISFFQQIKRELIDNTNPKAALYVVKNRDKIIGGAVCIFSKDESYLWYSGGMNKTYRSAYPGILAVYKALKDAQEKGLKHLEFMDVGLPFRKHAYREFVLRFGGRQTSTRRWFRFKWKWLNNLCTRFAD